MLLGILLSAICVTNLPPPYYTVYADALHAPLAGQMEQLALPLRENIRGNSTYVNTRRYLLGPDNPGFLMTKDGSGLGADGAISVAALRLQAKTTENAAEAARCEALADWIAGGSKGLSPRAALRRDCAAAIARAGKLPHPRVFATAADFAALKEKAKTDALVRSGIARAIAGAEAWRGKDVSKYEFVGYQLLGVARQAVARLVADSFAYRMTGERRFVEDAVPELRAVCAFPSWNPRHTIDTGEMTLAVAIAYDWLYDALDAADRESAAAALERLGLRSDVPFAGWTRLQNNWVQVVAAGMSAACVALADRQPEACTDYLAATVECLPEAECVSAPDGVFPEGPGYWNYGIGFNAIALEVMRTAFGTDFGLSDVKGLKETAKYPALVTGTSGYWFDYSDSPGGKGSCPTVWWFARRFGQTSALTDYEVACFRETCAGRDGEMARTFPLTLFWIGEDLVARREPLPEVWVGQGELPVAVVSGDRSDHDAAYVAVKGGSPSYNHAHADEGSFVLDLLGERWAFDLGAEKYRSVEAAIGPSALWSPEPGSRRWTLTRLGTFGHNTLLVGGKGQDPRGFATLAREGESVAVDLSEVYPSARSVRRTVAAKGRMAEIVDALAGLAPGTEVRWAMTTDAEIVLPTESEGAVILRKNGKSVSVTAVSAQGGAWRVESAEPAGDFESRNPGMKRLIRTVPAGTDGTVALTVRVGASSVRGEPGLGPVDVIEAAVQAYSDEHVARYLAEVEREGVKEHGFPRLTANLGVLIAMGRSDRYELFTRMMDAACAGAVKGKMKLGSSGNEFSVKELVFALQMLERSEAFPPEVLARWRAALTSVRAEKSYTRIPPLGANRAYNWVVFGCASEQARIAADCGGDAAFVEKYVSDQLRWFDANGMYRDPDQPAVYDLVTRLQFAMILAKGYDGPSRAKLEELMDRAALPTLAMISACGEIPYGGRSNQFLHNNTFASALCRWYADRAFRKGDRPLAFRFLAAAEASTAALEGWLAAEPVRHVKNRYPRETGFGCEPYAYFDKYMVTMGSWALMDVAFGFGFPPVPQSPERRPEPPSVFATTPDFHLVFARAGDYSAQWDYNADPHYDCDGLGRIHRAGAPVALCLSTPCARHPNYRTEGTNVCDLAISPCGTNRLAFVEARTEGGAAVTVWTSGPDKWRCSLGADGLEMTLTGPGPLKLALPAFAFDGETRTDVVCDGTTLTVRYGGWRCSYRTDGKIVDTGADCWNRNGRYRRYEAVGKRALKVDVVIEKE